MYYTHIGVMFGDHDHGVLFMVSFVFVHSLSPKGIIICCLHFMFLVVTYSNPNQLIKIIPNRINIFLTNVFITLSFDVSAFSV